MGERITPRFLEDHPLLALPRRLPVRLESSRHLERLGPVFSLDSVGAYRPEQAYGVLDLGKELLVDIVTSYPQGMVFERNPSRDEYNRRALPFVFALPRRGDSFYLTNGLNESVWSTHVVYDKVRGQVVSAEIGPASASVTRLYLPTDNAEKRRLDALTLVQPRARSIVASTPFADEQVAQRFMDALGTRSLDTATYILNVLASKVTAQFLEKKGVKGVFMRPENGNPSSFSALPNGGVAPMTAAVRRMLHRPNIYQLDCIVAGKNPASYAAMREIASAYGARVA